MANNLALTLPRYHPWTTGIYHDDGDVVVVYQQRTGCTPYFVERLTFETDADSNMESSSALTGIVTFRRRFFKPTSLLAIVTRESGSTNWVDQTRSVVTSVAVNPCKWAYEEDEEVNPAAIAVGLRSPLTASSYMPRARCVAAAIGRHWRTPETSSTT